MLWAFLAAGLLLAATMGAGLAALFTTLKPHWSRRRRMLAAAAVLPAITLVLALGVAIFGFATGDPSMRDIIFAAILAWGAGFAALAFVGGYLGALTSFKARKG